jgi:hypothetical protein
MVSTAGKQWSSAVRNSRHDPPLQSRHRRRRCACCGQASPSKTRPGRFCSDRCRDAARRKRNHERFGRARGYPSSVPRISKNKRAFSKPCKGDFRDRGSHISGPSEVIAIAILAGRSWRQVVSPAGVESLVTTIKPAPSITLAISTFWSPTTTAIGADLWIPNFLRRAVESQAVPEAAA